MSPGMLSGQLHTFCTIVSVNGDNSWKPFGERACLPEQNCRRVAMLLPDDVCNMVQNHLMAILSAFVVFSGKYPC